ncbi:hypothetical protein TNCV_4471221 [Trichonephila clavipes]|uniref:Uncharacterized protein n=1 Tax=Trichonephila clavipes TaxID=2585209 RepID=A0A8X6SMM9_TRICX|nr:hypothetical protein TNCV_4471221 [Trichonephila clavipes]
MLRYMVTPPALRLDDDGTATDDVVSTCLRLAVLQYDLRSKSCTFTGMESSIQVSLIAKLCLASTTSDSGALLSHCRCSIGSSAMALAATQMVVVLT